jgi:hypothetical protein
MLLMEPCDLGIANLKLLLLSFENMSGLKINLSKSEVLILGTSEADQTRMANLLNCRLGAFPITYLGLPVSDKALRLSDWDFLTGKVGQRVNPWQGLFLALAGKLELTNSCLSSLPMFAMSLYMLYDATHAAFDKVHSCFFWEGVGGKRKYHMVDWATVCKPKMFGGLGILNTRLMNIALMLKWVWKLYQNTDGLWVDLLKAKYLETMTSSPQRSPVRDLNSGTRFRKLNGTSSWEASIGSKMGVGHTFGWIGGRVWALCGTIFWTFSTFDPSLSSLSGRHVTEKARAFSSAGLLAFQKRWSGIT